LVKTGPVREFLMTAAVFPEAEDIEALRVDAREEMDDCRSLNGIFTGNN
jgi:hypothetical protein